MLKLTYIGHSCCLLESGKGTVILDPFLTGNELASHSPDQIPKLSAILLTHGHADHLGDSIALSKRDGAPVVATFELASYCQSQGTEALPMNIGGAADFEWGRVKLVQAWHSSSYQSGDQIIYTGMPTGVLYSAEGKTVYHLGDTALFSDLELIAKRNGPIDIALAPIGNCFTMGIEDAVEAVKLIQPELTIPIHYNTFPPIQQDPKDFERRCQEAGFEVKPLQPGESLEI